MITAKLNYKHTKKFIDTTIRLEKEMQGETENITYDTAVEMVKYIRNNWSTSPSFSGNPPAVQKGVLDRGITVSKQGRIKGRFAGTDATAHFIKFDTSASGRGQYALAVNDGNRTAGIKGADERPFVEPAIKVFTPIYIAKLKRRLILRDGEVTFRDKPF